MEINLKSNMKIHNNFKARLYDEDGILIDEGYAENVVTNAIWANANIYNYNNPSSLHTPRVRLGVGEGVPSSSDTALFSPIGGNLTATNMVHSYNVPTSIKTFSVTAPATSSYVGEITEVGVYLGHSAGVGPLFSHALFLDAEGNPTSINKRDTDTLEVDVTIYVEVEYASPLEPNSKQLRPIYNLFEGTSGYSGLIYEWLGGGSSLATYFPRLSRDPYGHTTIGRPPANSDSRSVSVSKRTITFNKQRHSETQGNSGFANWIIFPEYGRIRLPNADLIPPYQLEPVKVGEGDGITTTFVCPVPEFVEGTDEVRVNGILQERGVDYTLKHDGNSVGSLSAVQMNKVPEANLGAGNFLRAGSWPTQHRVIEFEEPIRVNGMRLDGLTALNSYHAHLNIYYSMDGEQWTKIYDLKAERGLLTTYSPNWHDFGETIETKWWKLSIEGGSYDSDYNRLTNNNSYLGLKPDPSDGLVFTTPPPAGSIITLTCTVDRPYKTSDYLFDTSYKVGY